MAISVPKALVAAAVVQAHNKYPDIPINVLWGQLGKETTFGQAIGNSTSNPPAVGIAQWRPPGFGPPASYGYPLVNSSSPAIIFKQVEAQAHYLHDQAHKLGSLSAAITSYGGGYSLQDVINMANTDPITKYGDYGHGPGGNQPNPNAGPGTGFLGTGVGPNVAPGASEPIAAGGHAIASTASAIPDFLAKLVDPQTWLRVLYFVLGLVLGVMALRQLASAASGSQKVVGPPRPV